ncbi:MAG: ubiquinol-cytochrome c reductase iron-sulfur subunit N-terminal domain-containing protein, partial [Thiohalocapsa sp.]
MSAVTSPPPTRPSRRDFLFIATATVAGVGAAATLVPLINQMNPDAATWAAGGPVDIDLSHMTPGQQIVARWRSRPIFITRRTDALLKELRLPSL